VGREVEFRQDTDRFLRVLAANGFAWDGTKISRVAGPFGIEVYREALGALEAEHVDREFERIIASIDTDPGDAITAARALVETVCKVILERLNEPVDDRADLPALYHAATAALGLDPAGMDQPIFKQVLGGLVSSVQGLAEVRNRLGDAHGKRSSAPRPRPRHARMAAGAAWTISVFLAETFAERTQATGR
jgi:hypothetical protein